MGPLWCAKSVTGIDHEDEANTAHIFWVETEVPLTNSNPIGCEPYWHKAEFGGDRDSFCLHVCFYEYGLLGTFSKKRDLDE